MSRVLTTFLTHWRVFHFRWFCLGISHNLILRRSWMNVLHAYTRGILNFLMTVQSWIAILLEFSQLFQAGGCAEMRFACIFSSIFDARHNNMLRNLTLHVFSRVVLHARQWKTWKIAFSHHFLYVLSMKIPLPQVAIHMYFIDDSGICMTFIPISLLAAAWILISMHFLMCF